MTSDTVSRWREQIATLGYKTYHWLIIMLINCQLPKLGASISHKVDSWDGSISCIKHICGSVIQTDCGDIWGLERIAPNCANWNFFQHISEFIWIMGWLLKWWKWKWQLTIHGNNIKRSPDRLNSHQNRIVCGGSPPITNNVGHMFPVKTW